MLAKIKALIDSSPFQIFFAAWTGFYLVQLYLGQISSSKSLWPWLVGGAVVALLIL